MNKVYLFPGQGSQFVGMGKDIFEQSDIAKQIYQSASDILGFDLVDISFNGPEDKLRQTQFTQPAIFVHSVAVYNLLKEHNLFPSAVAGHSLGEFSALVAANVLTFEDALNIVKVRSSEMAKAGSIQPGSMAAILGADDEQIEQICNQDGVVVPANINALGQIVISGEVDAVASAVETAKSLGIRKAIPLNVSGAFHSPLMVPAREPLSKILESVKFNNTDIPVYQNVTASPETDAEIIKDNILKQLENPVRWADIITNMISDGFTDFIEVGPNKVLSGLNRRINRDVNSTPIGTFEQIQNLIA
ncbi:MAG: ACP S-malonyltransferase [Candidatus Marinimicrobia bacterium]|nr:ACP S-malonyltransferase [Candidatus Neomarinimicrobiota bacterium]MBL7023434.1 ACP S-malonyltransferase [Candidatus Neomarinimicrobiota bacterium]MBL7108817.1 ACP S-malonyltransferase [Candidatus Neomarinimicrobiota bacterium]